MSDAIWDIEYSKAFSLKGEIKKYCEKNNLRFSIISENARSWELEETLAELKRRPKNSPGMGDFDTPRMSRLPDADLVE